MPNSRAPSPARTPASPAPGATSPCPGCGRPVSHTAALCTHCGQQVRTEAKLETRVGPPERTGLPPIPPIAPGPALFRGRQVDTDARRALTRAVLTLVFCVGVILVWKAAESGAAEVGAYATRLGITIAAAWGIALLEGIMLIEVAVSIPLAALGIAAALSAGDLTQHIVHYTSIPTLAWVLACTAFLFTVADLLDLEFHDAAFLTLAIYLMKVILKWTLFATMFPEG